MVAYLGTYLADCSFSWTRGMEQQRGMLQVSKVEFMMFILENLKLVGRDELSKILELFDSVDHDQDGILTIQVRASLVQLYRYRYMYDILSEENVFSMFYVLCSNGFMTPPVCMIPVPPSATSRLLYELLVRMRLGFLVVSPFRIA
jgi:hypothetical protein